MEEYPNFKGARVIAVCLNTMGFRLDHAVHKPKETRALKRALIGWIRKHYLTIFERYPEVARACTGGGITFDEEELTLIKTYSSLLGKEPNRDFFPLS